jgi:two-component system sensor histidine kinase/response regulator
VHVVSAPGRGSTFSIYLRLRLAGQPRTEADQVGRLRDMRVLVVDDNRSNREILTHQLGGWGMQVSRASGGRQALTVLRESLPFALIILDMCMPEMDGLELAKAIQGLPGQQSIPLMLLTSAPIGLNRDERAATGVRRYLNKPVRRKELLSAVSSTLIPTEECPDATVSVKFIPPIRPYGRILLVEDIATNRDVALAMLAAIGLEATVAKNGRQAVDLVSAQEFDLVLMDCQMPVLDGFEATALIRQLTCAWGSRMPIVALTANALAGDEQKCLAAGMNGFLAKPFTMAGLKAVLLQWLPTESVVTEGAAPVPISIVGRSNSQSESDPINLEALATLRHIESLAGRELVKPLLANFIKQAPVDIAEMDSAMAARDGAKVSRLAHGLKSSTANIGAITLSGCYQRLERCARDEELVGAADLVRQLLMEHARVLSRLSELVEENG